MIYQSHTLDNGLRIVHVPTEGNVLYCGFYVNAGTRDEADDEHGIAHFVEHMLFKGTKKRRAHHIVNRMENVGGELNAYTNKEETVIYSIFLKEHFERAFELLTDITFHSQFPQREMDKEKHVIIDEIDSYEDSPSELIYDDFENILFEGSGLGHNILGDPDTLENFTSADLKAFVARNYKANNIVFFSLGQYDFKKIIRYAEKYLAEIPAGSYTPNRLDVSNIDAVSKKLIKDTSQVHALIGGRSYNIKDPKRKAFSLLNNILGGPGMNSRLNVELREKKGYVYGVESSATAYSNTGMFSIYFGTGHRNEQKCIDIIHRELKKLKTNKLSAVQLAAAKKQMMGQMAVARDNRESLTLSLGRSFFHFNHINSLEESFAFIENITSIDLLEVANEIFDESNLFKLVYN